MRPNKFTYSLNSRLSKDFLEVNYPKNNYYTANDFKRLNINLTNVNPSSKIILINNGNEISITNVSQYEIYLSDINYENFKILLKKNQDFKLNEPLDNFKLLIFISKGKSRIIYFQKIDSRESSLDDNGEINQYSNEKNQNYSFLWNNNEDEKYKPSGENSKFKNSFENTNINEPILIKKKNSAYYRNELNFDLSNNNNNIYLSSNNYSILKNQNLKLINKSSPKNMKTIDYNKNDLIELNPNINYEIAENFIKIGTPLKKKKENVNKYKVINDEAENEYYNYNTSEKRNIRTSQEGEYSNINSNSKSHICLSDFNILNPKNKISSDRYLSYIEENKKYNLRPKGQKINFDDNPPKRTSTKNVISINEENEENKHTNLNGSTKSDINYKNIIPLSGGKRLRPDFSENEKGEREIYSNLLIENEFQTKRLKKNKSRELELPLSVICPICYDSIRNLSNLDSCPHDFCKDCIMEWSKKTNSCPMCKKEFKKIKYYVKGKQIEIKVKKKKLEVEDIFEVEEIFEDEEEDDFYSSQCQKCYSENDQENLLICDSCGFNVCHTYCDNLTGVPEGDWYCLDCRGTFEENNEVKENFHEDSSKVEEKKYSELDVFEKLEEIDKHKLDFLQNKEFSAQFNRINNFGNNFKNICNEKIIEGNQNILIENDNKNYSLDFIQRNVCNSKNREFIINTNNINLNLNQNIGSERRNLRHKNNYSNNINIYNKKVNFSSNKEMNFIEFKNENYRRRREDEDKNFLLNSKNVCINDYEEKQYDSEFSNFIENNRTISKKKNFKNKLKKKNKKFESDKILEDELGNPLDNFINDDEGNLNYSSKDKLKHTKFSKINIRKNSEKSNCSRNDSSNIDKKSKLIEEFDEYEYHENISFNFTNKADKNKLKIKIEKDQKIEKNFKNKNKNLFFFKDINVSEKSIRNNKQKSNVKLDKNNEKKNIIIENSQERNNKFEDKKLNKKNKLYISDSDEEDLEIFLKNNK